MKKIALLISIFVLSATASAVPEWTTYINGIYYC